MVPTGESFVFDVLDREGGFLYTTEAQNATWVNGLAHTETLEAVFGGYFGFNLVGMQPNRPGAGRGCACVHLSAL